MSIPCSEINQTINELLISFENCSRIQNKDLVKLVELVAAVRNCGDSLGNYNELVNEYYDVIEDFNLSYEAHLLHSITIIVLEGSVQENINSNNIEYTSGSVINLEFTTVNANELNFVIKAGSKVVVKYLIEEL